MICKVSNRCLKSSEAHILRHYQTQLPESEIHFPVWGERAGNGIEGEGVSLSSVVKWN